MQMFKRVLLSSLFLLTLCLNLPRHAFAVPASITNLSGLASTTTRGIVLTWTAPSDGGSPAAGYDVRVATTTFTDTDWDAGWVNPVLGEPAPSAPGTTQTMTVSGLAGGATYYFRMKSNDASQTMSAISNNPIAWACVPFLVNNQYDLSVDTGVTRWAYESTAADITTSVAGTGFITEQYTGIAYDDLAAGVSTGTAAEIIAQRFLFKVSQSTPTITKLSVAWRGWNEGELGVGAVPSLYIWDYNSGTPGWDLIASGSGSLSDQPLSGEFTTNINYYISNSSCNLKLTCPDPGSTAKRSRIHSNYVSLLVSYSVAADTIAPAAITNLSGATGAMDKQVSLSWTAPGDNGASGNNGPTAAYEVRYATFGVTTDTGTWWNGGYGALSTYTQNWPVEYQGVTETKTLTMLESGTAYWFAVQTIDASGNPSGISGLSGRGPVRAVSKYPPGQVTGFTAVAGEQVYLSWTAPGDHGYEGNVTGGKWRIDYSSSTTTPGPDASYSLEISSSFTQGVSYGCTITGLLPRTTYYFQIIARDGGGNWGTVWSSSANAVSGSFCDLGAELSGVSCSAQSWGDYDSDGDLDLALAGTYDGANYISRVYRNDAGTLIHATGTTITGVGYCSLSWGDFDSDGDLDLALAGTYDGANYISRVYRNEAGTFTNATGTTITGVNRCSLSWGDYDNDGDLDLALAGEYPASSFISRVYRNDAGTFTNATGTSITGVGYCSLSWGDYDNDGDLDLALAGDGGSGCISRVYRNVAGSFVDAMGTSITGVNNCSLSWGDYDNDGDLDLALAGFTGDIDLSRVYRNEAGSFITEPGISITDVYMCSLSWGDYDNDGDLDLALAGNSDYWGPLSLVYRNDPASFVNATDNSISGVYYCSLSWGDYDADGDLDLALAGKSGTGSISRIYRSLEADYGNANKDARAPSAPGTGFSSGYTYSTKTLSLRWGKGADNGSGATTADGLYYELRAATETLSDRLKKWVVSPSTGLGVGSASSQNCGNYPHGYCVASSTQPGTVITSTNIMEGNTYYWQVRTIDAGLAKSAWSAQQLYYVAPSTIPPAGISNLTALEGGSHKVILEWTAPGGNDTTGDLMTGSMFRIKYSSVAIITAGNFDAPPSNCAVSTIDISTATTALAYQTTTLTNLQNGATYWFAIKTMDNFGNWSVWNSSGDVSTINTVAWKCVGDSIAPGQVTGLTATPGCQAKLSWTAPGNNNYTGNVTGGMWRIDYSSITNPPGGVVSSTVYSQYISTSFIQVSTIYSQVMTGLQPRATYYFQIIARDDADNWGTVWSSSVCAVAGSFFDNNDGLPGLNTSSLAWGDYDNDGDLDLALMGDTGSGDITRIYRRDPGSFVDIGADITGLSKGELSWGDYDNDGDLDLAIVGTYGTRVSRIYRNDASNFADINAGLTGVSYGVVSWGDYDNDGDLDLVLAGWCGISISSIYRNDSGSLLPANAGLTGVQYAAVRWADYDNDGDLDLAISGTYGSDMSRIYRNTNGNFADAVVGIYPIAYGSFAWGDYDNDGYLDLAMSGTYGAPNTFTRVYRNVGGVFSDRLFGLAGVISGSLSWGDYDNDGDLDLAVSGQNILASVYITRIYGNNGASFADINAGLTGVGQGSLSWGDYDTDGDLDLAVVGKGLGYTYTSLEAQFGNINAIPVPPSGMTAKYSYAVENSTIAFQWDPGQYSVGQSSNSLYYQIVMATNPTTWDGTKFTSPSKFKFPWQNGSPLMGNYVRPAAKLWPGDATVKHTIFYSTAATILTTNTTYYWRVRTIDAGLQRSAWSAEYSICTTAGDVTSPAGISNLTAMSGGTNAVMLAWTSPGDDGTSNSLANGLYRIKYSTVAIIKSDDFEATASSYCATTLDISTTTAAVSYQTATISNLIGGTTYWFAIKTMDNAGNWSVWKSSKDVATINTLAWYTVPSVGGNDPNMPAGLALYTSTTTWPALTAGSWTNYQRVVATFTLTDPDSADTVQYNIQFSTQADFSYNYVNSTAPASATLAQGATYYISPLLPDGTWYWRVRAIDGYGYASAYASMTAVNGIHFGIDATAPQAITTLGAVTGFDPGIIHLSWTAPGDDGSANAISGGAYRVRYATYVTGAGDYWTDASANWMDWTNKYEVTWPTGTVPLAAQARTLTGLTAGVTYYMRVWARDEIAGSGEWDGNWSALSFGATTYAQAVLLDVNAQPDIALDLGAVATRTTKILASSFTVINTGNVQVQYRLQLTGVPGAWSVQETPGATAGYDQIKLLALFTTMNPPGSADFTDDIAPNAGGDIVRASTYDVATSSSFAVAAESATVKGYACTVGSVRRLWFRFDAPWATAVITQQNLTITVTAIQD